MMRKFFASIILFLVLFNGVISPSLFSASPVFAQIDNTQQPTSVDGDPTNESSDPNAKEKSQVSEIRCGITDVGCGIVKIFTNLLLYVPVLITTVAGLIFDYTIWYSIQGETYSAYDGQVGDEGLVVMGWKLVRDFSNLVFIFALFTIAFSLILNTNYFGLEPKKTIARVIIMALLVNFSFFLTRSVIEVTNIISQVFYVNMTGAPKAIGTELGVESLQTESPKADQVGLGNASDFYTNAFGIRSVSTAILAQSNPQQLFLQAIDKDGKGVNYADLDFGATSTLLFIAFMSFLFNFLLIYIFISIAVLFISRTIGLFLGVILSPIAFVSRTIPALESKSYVGFEDWSKQLFGLAFLAPVFLFFLYISIQFFNAGEGLNDTTSTNYWIVITTILFKLLMIAAFMLFSKKIASDMAGKMGELVTKGITSVATGAVTVAGVAATGGMAGVGTFARNYATDRVKSGAISAGTSVMGSERVEELQKRWGTLKNFDNNPRAAVSALRKVVSAGPNDNPGVLSQMGSSFRYGSNALRMRDMEEAKIAAEKIKREKGAENKWKTREVDKKVSKLKTDLAKDLEDGVITKKEYNKQLEEGLKKLALEKREILNPTSKQQQATVAANNVARDVREKKETNEKELATNQSKIVDLETKISNSSAVLADAATKLAEATKNRTDASQDVVQKKAEIDAKKSDDQKLEQELAQTEQELKSLPRTGFGVDRAKIDALEQKRSGIVSQRSLIQGSIQQMATELHSLEEKEKLLISIEEQAINQKDTAEAMHTNLQTDKAKAETQQVSLEAEKTSLETALADAEKTAAEATATQKQAEEAVKLQDELALRTATPKNDTENRRRNQERIDAIQNRLAVISGALTPQPNSSGSGGTPPPAPSGSGGTPPPAPSGSATP